MSVEVKAEAALVLLAIAAAAGEAAVTFAAEREDAAASVTATVDGSLIATSLSLSCGVLLPSILARLATGNVELATSVTALVDAISRFITAADR